MLYVSKKEVSTHELKFGDTLKVQMKDRVFEGKFINQSIGRLYATIHLLSKENELCAIHYGSNCAYIYTENHVNCFELIEASVVVDYMQFPIAYDKENQVFYFKRHEKQTVPAEVGMMLVGIGYGRKYKIVAINDHQIVVSCEDGGFEICSHVQAISYFHDVIATK